jgi:chemotaxis protein CheY-P-specific phosphatase CheC
MILDISNLLVSSFLVSFSKQLDISISLRQPIVLEKELLQVSLNSDQFLTAYDQEIFTIEFIYKAENLDITCDVIFLMDKESIQAIEQILQSVL